MKPEFPALDKADKLLWGFFDFSIMRSFAALMKGNELLNSDGLKPLNEKYEASQNAINEAEKEGLIILQQANDLTQQFYLQRLQDFGRVKSSKEYSTEWLKQSVIAYNFQYPQ